MAIPQDLPEKADSETNGEFFVPKVTPSEPVPETPNLGSDSSAVLNSDKALLRNVEKNDLTAIDGVGPFLEKKLNDAGVFTYADIASWDASKIAEITQTISFFEGRIEKDDWVGQAKKLLETGQNTNTRAEESIIAESRSLIAPEEDTLPIPVPSDNLKLIHGIDEAIETILLAAGVDSFTELSRMEPNELRNILVVVDPKLVEVDPSAWPAQARLAQDGHWEVLQDFQEQLKGG
jgi:predicted flap endonuclease-1-like 5' DNA nuclease